MGEKSWKLWYAYKKLSKQKKQKIEREEERPRGSAHKNDR